jgi:hypothetical protein
MTAPESGRLVPTLDSPGLRETLPSRITTFVASGTLVSGMIRFGGALTNPSICGINLKYIKPVTF